MTNRVETAESLVGRRFSCQFHVVAAGAALPGAPEDDRPMVLHMHGDRFVMSLGELRTLIDTGFVLEQPPLELVRPGDPDPRD